MILAVLVFGYLACVYSRIRKLINTPFNNKQEGYPAAVKYVGLY